MTARVQVAKCLRPGCGGFALTRGLCKTCYSTAYKLVRAKRVTWPQLEKAGKCTVAKHSGRQPGASIVWLLDGVKESK